MRVRETDGEAGMGDDGTGPDDGCMGRLAAKDGADGTLNPTFLHLN